MVDEINKKIGIFHLEPQHLNTTELWYVVKSREL